MVVGLGRRRRGKAISFSLLLGWLATGDLEDEDEDEDGATGGRGACLCLSVECV